MIDTDDRRNPAKRRALPDQPRAHIAHADFVPAVPDRKAAEAIGATLAPLERHLLSGDIVHARTTLWHLTRILDAYRTHPNDAVRAELGAIRLAVWVVYDYLKIPFGG